jgi:quercetin dioxygenase-like cupin family protein
MTAPARLRAVDVGLALALALASPASASAQEAPTRLNPTEIAAMAKGGAGAGTSGVAGIKTTVLSGDPTKAGPYTIEIRVPAHTRIGAHRHRDDRSAVVVSGTWWFGYGLRADEALLKALGPGSFYTEPAGQPHFALTRGEPAIVWTPAALPVWAESAPAASLVLPRPSYAEPSSQLTH